MAQNISLLIYSNLIYPRVGLGHAAFAERTRRFYLTAFTVPFVSQKTKYSDALKGKKAKEDLTGGGESPREVG